MTDFVTGTLITQAFLDALNENFEALSALIGDGEFSILADRAALQTTSVDATNSRVYLKFYNSSLPSNGGAAWYDRLAVAPTTIYPWHVQSLDGAWWEVSRQSQAVTPAMYGMPGTSITISPTDPWGTIIEDAAATISSPTIRFNNAIDVSGYNSGGFTWPTPITIKNNAINLNAITVGQVDVNANFVITNSGRVRALGLNFLLYPSNGPQDAVFTIGNTTLALVNCTATNYGAGGEYVSATRDGNCKVDIDPSNDTRENVIDWSASTGRDVIIGEGNVDVFLRAGKISDGMGGWLAARYRVIILCPANSRGGVYVLRGRGYFRSPTIIGKGTGNGLVLVRGGMAYMHPYQVQTPNPMITDFRQTGYVYSDEVRCGVFNFDKCVSLRSNAILTNTSDDPDDDGTTGVGVWVLEGTTGVYLSSGHFNWKSDSSLDMTGCATQVRRDDLRKAVIENELAVYETTWSGLPAASAANDKAVVRVTDVGNHSLWRSTATKWIPFNRAPIYAADVGATDDYAITLPLVAELENGLMVVFKANTANTGAATLNVTFSDGTTSGAKDIVKGVSTVLSDNDILALMFCQVVWDVTGDRWVLMNPRTL